MSAAIAPDWHGLPEGYWRTIFGNSAPVAIEIGPGLGEFLEFIAKRHGDWNYYAIERSRTRADAVQRRIDDARLDNTRVLCAPAECVLAILPESSVDRIYIQFPDPWWKRRHKRRRLLTPTLVAEVRRVLKIGAEVEFVTDVEEYFAVAHRALIADPGLEEIPSDPELKTATSFSRKAEKRGWKLHAATLRKIVSA